MLSAKGPLKITVRLAPPETPGGGISTVLSTVQQEHWGLLLSKEVIFDQISIPCLQRPAVLNGAPGRGLTGEGNDKNPSACQPCNGWEMKACDSLGKRNEIDSAWGGG